MILKDRNILIFGGQGLLGEAVSSAVIRQGGMPILTSRDEKFVNEFNAINEASATKAKAYCVKMDSEREILEHIASIEKDVGEVHSYVHNVYAALDYKSVEETPWSHWEETTRVSIAVANSIASFFAQESRCYRFNSIVNIASIYAYRAPNLTMYEGGSKPNPVYYGTTKASVLALTRYLAVYLAKKDIRVNAVSPGGILSDQDEPFLKRYNASVPMERMVSAAEVSNVVMFLLSGMASGITGQNIVVDAGKTLW